MSTELLSTDNDRHGEPADGGSVAHTTETIDPRPSLDKVSIKPKHAQYHPYYEASTTFVNGNDFVLVESGGSTESIARERLADLHDRLFGVSARLRSERDHARAEVERLTKIEAAARRAMVVIDDILDDGSSEAERGYRDDIDELRDLLSSTPRVERDSPASADETDAE